MTQLPLKRCQLMRAEKHQRHVQPSTQRQQSWLRSLEIEGGEGGYIPESKAVKRKAFVDQCRQRFNGAAALTAQADHQDRPSA
jgi:hypothetical protein